MPPLGLELTTTAFERAETVLTSDRVATVIGLPVEAFEYVKLSGPCA
jgi:hypothetical protein